MQREYNDSKDLRPARVERSKGAGRRQTGLGVELLEALRRSGSSVVHRTRLLRTDPSRYQARLLAIGSASCFFEHTTNERPPRYLIMGVQFNWDGRSVNITQLMGTEYNRPPQARQGPVQRTPAH